MFIDAWLHIFIYNTFVKTHTQLRKLLSLFTCNDSLLQCSANQKYLLLLLQTILRQRIVLLRYLCNKYSVVFFIRLSDDVWPLINKLMLYFFISISSYKKSSCYGSIFNFIMHYKFSRADDYVHEIKYPPFEPNSKFKSKYLEL